LESATTVLKRIQQERMQRYQQQLADWEKSPSIPLLQRGKPTSTAPIPPLEKGGRGGISKPKPPKCLPPFTAEELAGLPELPEGWVYSYLADLGDLGRGKSKHRPRNDSRLFGGIYPFIQTGEVKSANRIIRQYSQTYSDFGLQQSKLWPTGTLCITIAANIAETAFLGFDGCFPDSVVGFSAFKKTIIPEYVDFFIQAARMRIEAYAPATAQKNINLETLENLVVPYCCLEEQRQILDILEERFSVIDQLDQTITASLKQAEALRQSILKKAFSGQLVPQDPNDEPASELLARIRAERLASQGNLVVRRKGGRS
jgi:type I restriction enzyme S subunit